MTTIDKLGPKVERLIEQIRSLGFVFKNDELEQEADEDKNAAIASLESYLAAAEKDWEEGGHSEEEGEND